MHARRQSALVFALILLAPSVAVLPAAAASLEVGDDTAADAVSTRASPHAPVFEKNVGQLAGEALFTARAGAVTTYLTPDGFVLTRPAASDDETLDIVRMRLVNATPASAVRGLDEVAYKTNYYLGNDPSSWFAQVPHFARVSYTAVYPGVDLLYYGTPQGNVEYDFVVAPGADPRAVRLAFEGAASAALDEEGDLVFDFPGAPLRQSAPVAYQLDDAGARVPVVSRYALRADGTVGLELGAYDRARILVIDPVIVYSTYLVVQDSRPNEAARGVAIDGAGNARVVGWWNSHLGGGIYKEGVMLADYTSEGDKISGLGDSGGSHRPLAMALDSAGRRIIAGESCGQYNAPFSPFGSPNNPGGCTAFVAKLSESENGIYATFLGGSAFDSAYGVAVDSTGSAIVAGQTCSSSFPILNATQGSNPGGCSGFVTKLTSTGTLSYSTFVGGSGNDGARAVDVDAWDNAVIAGFTDSSNLPTQNPIQAANPGGMSVFVMQLTSSGALSYSTYLGGAGSDEGHGISVDPDANAWLTGRTCSSDFPAINTNPGGCSAFVATLTRDGTFVRASYLGGTADDDGLAIAADRFGNALVTGSTCSADFPALKATQLSDPGGCSAFVAKYTSIGELSYSTYLGGSGAEWGHGIAADAEGSAIVVGRTCSSDFPTSATADEGSLEAAGCAGFVTKLADPETTPQGVEPPTLPFACGDTVVLLGACVVPPANDSSESPTGNTPFGGMPLKPTWPDAPSSAPVNLATGELVATFRALSLRQPLGDELPLDLTFRSIGNANGSSGLSARWSASWLERLEIRGGDYVHHTGDGRALRFAKAGTTWIGPPGVYATMTTVSGKVEMTEADGSRRIFDPAKRLALTDIVDPAGNRWTLAYLASGQLSTLTDPLGRVFTVQHDVTTGRLSSVTDPAGRGASFLYDGGGRLTSIRTQGATTGTWLTTQILYDANGRIVAVRDPANVEYTTFSYDPAGRVLSQVDALDGTHAFAYDPAAGTTQETDPNGNVVTWEFLWPTSTTPTVLPVRKVEGDRTTTYEYNSQGELRKITHPAGNSDTMRYDDAAANPRARGNLLEHTRAPGPASASPQTTTQLNITTRYTYDPTCNLPATIVDPRGADPSFVPPNGGTANAARYTTTITYVAGCKPFLVKAPRANPSGAPSASFTSAYSNQLVQESFTYNGAGQVVTHADPAGTLTSYAYHASPSAIGKPAGHLASITVDPGAAPRLNLATAFEYNAFGVVNKTIDPNGNVRRIDLDLRGRPTQETGPAVTSASGVTAGLRTRWTYDGNDQLLRVEREKDAGSNAFTSIEATYDALGRYASDTIRPSAATSITTTYGYDANGNLIRRTGATGEEQTWSYDERDLVVAASGPDGGTYAYDANGNIASVTDPLGRSTTFEYDGYDRLAVATDAMQSRFVTSYDPAGNVVNEKGLAAANGRVLFERTYAHDELDRPYERREWMQAAATMPVGSAANPLGRWVTSLQQYDARGLATRAIDDNGRVTTMTYDAAGRPLNVTDPSGNAEKRTYDRNGNVATLTRAAAGPTGACPRVCTTSFAYDALDRRVSATNPDATMRQFAYDGRGNLVRTTDEAGHVEWHDHDDADRPTATRRVLSPTATITTTTAWDAEGRVIRACDHAGECTATTYVPATSLVATLTPPTGPSVVNTYDAAGNLVQATYSSGKQVALAYDALDRLTSVSVAGLPAAGGTTRQQFQYDEMGRLTHATDNGAGNLGTGVVSALGQITLTQQFDTLGRVIGETQLGLPVTHTIDGVGNTLSTAYPSPDGRVVSRSYDTAERLERTWDGKGLIAAYTYEHDRVVAKAFGGPASGASPVARTLTTYDDMERPETIVHKRGTTNLATLVTGYDLVGNRASQQLSAGATDAYSQRYQHDPIDRTQSWQRGPLAGPPTASGSWTIDGQNDWVTYDPGTGPCTRTTAVTGSPPVRDVSDVCPNDPARTRTYTYDADGNLVWDGTFAYTWDFLNRLIRVDDADGDLVVGYAYDALGRRVVKIFPGNVAAAAPGVQAPREAWYTYAGRDLIQESQPVGSVLPLGATPTAPSVHVIRQWVYGPGVDEALAMDVDAGQDGQGAIGAGDKRYYYAYDSGANVLGLLGETGRMVEGYAYGAYGDVSILVPSSGRQDVLWDGADATSTGLYGSDPTPHPYSPSGNLWYFTGRQYDPEIGSYHYRARQYHPTLGQFMSIDPVGAWHDATNLGNPYSYVGNNPGSRRDPTGHVAETVWDAANCGYGAYTTVQDFREGAWGWGIFGAVGTAIDCAATAVPFIPGGVTTAGKGVRALSSAGDAANAADDASDAARAADRANDAAKASRLPLETKADEAVFWSGLGRDGRNVAAEWTAKNGGATLETTMKARGVTLPEYSSATKDLWRQASKDFADGAKGNVRVLVQKDRVRPDSIWSTVELPALKANPNVKSIRAIDPRTGVESLLWQR